MWRASSSIYNDEPDTSTHIRPTAGDTHGWCGADLTSAYDDPNWTDRVDQSTRSTCTQRARGYWTTRVPVHVVCDHLLDPENNRRCGYEGTILLTASKRARSFSCGNWIYADQADIDEAIAVALNDPGRDSWNNEAKGAGDG